MFGGSVREIVVGPRMQSLRDIILSGQDSFGRQDDEEPNP